MSGPVHVSVLIGRYLDQVLAKQDAEHGKGDPAKGRAALAALRAAVTK